jgi:glycosyltransferase involved in cell wall biosynthesis
VLTRPPAWLGGGTHVRQMVGTVETRGNPGDRVVVVGTLRGGTADVRLPAGMTARLGPRGLRAVGSTLWRNQCVHRISVDIPPAPDEIVSILDLAPLHFPDEGSLPPSLADQVRRARGVVVSTRTIADEVMSELGAERVWFVPPAVDDRFFTHQGNAGDDRPPYVLHVGGATRRKGVDVLAAAWPAIRSAHPGLELVMVGPEHPTGRSGLIGRTGVRWCGQVRDGELPGLMAGARAVVVPSTYEGFGMPVAEAMAVGTPVVVVAGTAPAEVGAGVAFAAAANGGADALAAAVAAAAGDRDPARLTVGRAAAAAWSVEAVAQMQLSAYGDAFG